MIFHISIMIQLDEFYGSLSKYGLIFFKFKFFCGSP